MSEANKSGEHGDMLRPPAASAAHLPRSSSGLGRHPLKVVARVQIPYGVRLPGQEIAFDLRRLRRLRITLLL